MSKKKIAINECQIKSVLHSTHVHIIKLFDNCTVWSRGDDCIYLDVLQQKLNDYNVRSMRFKKCTSINNPNNYYN